MAKLYEALIRNRLIREIEERGDFANNQYGFRKRKSTILAIEHVMGIAKRANEKYSVLITIDIQNAFNSAPWCILMEKLVSWGISPYLRNTISSYLNNRVVELGKIRKQMTAGVPQGSALGPTLWNVVYDDIFRVPLTEGASLVGFEDDIALVIKASDIKSLDERANVCLRKIDQWLQDHYLDLAPGKTEAVLFRCPRNVPTKTNFCLRGQIIQPKKTVKYLGVYLNWQRTFGTHVTEVCLKAGDRAARLSRMLPNIGGPSEIKRRLLVGVVQSIILYAAPIWVEAIRIKKYEKTLLSTQRKILMRVISAYKTISVEATQAITGTPPITLLALERARIHERSEGNLEAVKKAEREATLNLWQEKWVTNNEKAQWTKTLIPNIISWTNCKHRRTDYYLTQMLSGHGCLGSYLHRIGKKDDDKCFFCEEVDTPEHTLFKCPRWTEDRTTFETRLGQRLKVNTVVESMIDNEKN